MSQVYCIRRRRKGKHLEYVDRQELEHLVTQNIKASKKNKKTQQELAVLLGVSPSTMSRELKRGLIVLRDSEWREYESYSADVAQDDYDKKATHKGPGLKIGNDHALAKHIEDKILKEKYSPDAVIMEIESGKYEQENMNSKRRFAPGQCTITLSRGYLPI